MKNVLMVILTLGIGGGVGYAAGHVKAKEEFWEAMRKATLNVVEKEEEEP